MSTIEAVLSSLFIVGAMIGGIAWMAILSGCTPRTNLAHQYHVTAIKIGEVETRTDFLLGEK